jgi:hypothetical protein
MTVLEWTLSAMLVTLYFAVLITAGVTTFSKGRWVLGIFGLFFPLLWLLGMFLPARPGSRYAAHQRYDTNTAFQTRYY